MCGMLISILGQESYANGDELRVEVRLMLVLSDA